MTCVMVFKLGVLPVIERLTSLPPPPLLCWFVPHPPRRRHKNPAAAAMVFSYKLGALPENVLQTLLNDRLVAKGSVMHFMTTFFQVGVGGWVTGWLVGGEMG